MRSDTPPPPPPPEEVPSSVWTRHGAVKQGKSGGSVDTTSQKERKGK